MAGRLHAMSDLLTIEDRGSVRWVTIERPHRKNAIPPGGWATLADTLRDFEDSDARALVLQGRGADFCTGADLADDALGATAGVRSNAAQMRITGDAATALHRLSKPTVAAVDGVAAGAGMNLALGCDIVVATDRAMFSEIFVRRGLALDFGGTWLLPRLVGLARARDLALTGRMVDAVEALEIGLVSRVVPVGDLDATVTETASQLAAGAPLAQRFLKAGLDRSLDLTFEQAIEFENQMQAVLLASDDFREGVASFRERRRPEFKGR